MTINTIPSTPSCKISFDDFFRSGRGVEHGCVRPEPQEGVGLDGGEEKTSQDRVDRRSQGQKVPQLSCNFILATAIIAILLT